MKYLIVTADDLGLTESINEGIAKAYREGIVKSVSVIAPGEAFEDAIKVINDLKLKEIGPHLALTEVRPVLGSSKFYKSHNQFFVNFLLGRVDSGDVYEELRAQLDLLKNTGVEITHINCHEHLHVVPKILDIFIRLAKEYNIPAIRYPRGDRPPKKFLAGEIYKSSMLSFFSKKTKDIFRKSGLLYTDFFLGLLDAGLLDENKLIEMFNGLNDGVTELVTHPGFLGPKVLEDYRWHMGGETELFALTGAKIRNAVKANDIKLISYQDFLSIKK